MRPATPQLDDAFPAPAATSVRRFAAGFTIVEALVALACLMIFMLSSTASLNLMDDRAARNRNMEAARAIVDDYVNYLLADATAAPAATSAGTDIDGDGVTDGVQCTTIGSRTVPTSIPIVVARNSSATPIVTGTLYWKVQAVGTTYGCTNSTDLMQVNFLLKYQYRNQTFYYKVLTFKANS